MRLGIDYSKIELQREPSIGLGGKAPVYKIKSECKITFSTADGEPYVESVADFDVGKAVIKKEEERKLVFDMIPSLFGMDILERFKLVATKNEAYLER